MATGRFDNDSMNALPDHAASYRIGRFIRLTSLGFIVFIVVVVFGAFVEDYQKQSSNTGEARLIVALSCLLAFAIGFCVYCVRYRLIISDDRVTQTRLIRKATLKASEFVRVVWRADGSVLLRTSDRKMHIEFILFSAKDRPEIISQLHGLADASKHEGWVRFSQLQNIKSEPISLVRILVGTMAAATIAVPLLFLAEWLAGPKETFMAFALMFFTTLVLIAHALGWRPRSVRNAMLQGNDST